MEKRRIEYIDLAKGICILLVVMGHAGADINLPGFGMMRMPLYYMLSGMFFKDYGGFLQHVIRKINKILIPFLFFYITAYIPFYIFEYLKPGLIQTEAHGIIDLFNNRQFFNGPIWFLLSLFWDNLIFCLISLHVQNKYMKGLFVMAIGFVGFILGENDVFLPLFIDVAMTALPLFYIGYLLTKTDILYPNKYDRWNIIILIIGYGITYLLARFFDDPHFSFHYNKIRGNIFINYLGAVSCVIAILLFCKMVKRIPIISYCGRYSIILLCLHHMIYRPIQLIVYKINTPPHLILGIDPNPWIVAIITVAICIAFIPVCKRYIPWFVAQKDLIKIQ